MEVSGVWGDGGCLAGLGGEGRKREEVHYCWLTEDSIREVRERGKKVYLSIRRPARASLKLDYKLQVKSTNDIHSIRSSLRPSEAPPTSEKYGRMSRDRIPY